MIKNPRLFNQFERDLIKNSPVDFHQNLRIVSDLHQKARALKAFQIKLDLDIEHKVRYARAINFTR